MLRQKLHLRKRAVKKCAVKKCIDKKWVDEKIQKKNWWTKKYTDGKMWVEKL